MDALWLFVLFSVGMTLGFFLCATLVMAREDQAKGVRQRLPGASHPLESDTQF